MQELIVVNLTFTKNIPVNMCPIKYEIDAWNHVSWMNRIDRNLQADNQHALKKLKFFFLNFNEVTFPTISWELLEYFN